MQLSIPKTLNCSRIVAKKAIAKKFKLKLFCWANPIEQIIIKLVKNIVKVPNNDFFCLKIIQLFELKLLPINPAKPSPKVIIKNPAIKAYGFLSQKSQIKINKLRQ